MLVHSLLISKLIYHCLLRHLECYTKSTFNSFHVSTKYSEFARSPLSFPQTLFSHSLSSTICNLVHPHPIRTLWITYGGPERTEKRSLGEREGRSSKLRIEKKNRFSHTNHKYDEQNLEPSFEYIKYYTRTIRAEACLEVKFHKLETRLKKCFQKLLGLKTHSQKQDHSKNLWQLIL